MAKTNVFPLKMVCITFKQRQIFMYSVYRNILKLSQEGDWIYCKGIETYN
jgi:hypothetical protein